MMEELLSDLDSNQKIKILKYASVFAGGMIVGYSIKKVMDYYDLDVIKNNAINSVDDYVNPKREYTVNIEEILDEETVDEEVVNEEYIDK